MHLIKYLLSVTGLHNDNLHDGWQIGTEPAIDGTSVHPYLRKIASFV